MGSWGTDLSIPVGLRKILQRKVVENGIRKKRPRTGISRGNDRDAICAFKFAPSRHAFDLHTFMASNAMTRTQTIFCFSVREPDTALSPLAIHFECVQV